LGLQAWATGTLPITSFCSPTLEWECISCPTLAYWRKVTCFDVAGVLLLCVCVYVYVCV
jgi:hypothetical protein